MNPKPQCKDFSEFLRVNLLKNFFVLWACFETFSVIWSCRDVPLAWHRKVSYRTTVLILLYERAQGSSGFFPIATTAVMAALLKSSTIWAHRSVLTTVTNYPRMKLENSDTGLLKFWRSLLFAKVPLQKLKACVSTGSKLEIWYIGNFWRIQTCRGGFSLPGTLLRLTNNKVKTVQYFLIYCSEMERLFFSLSTIKHNFLAYLPSAKTKVAYFDKTSKFVSTVYVFLGQFND